MTRYLGDDYLLPALDPTNSPWFTSGSLQIQCCIDCDSAQHPPEDVCVQCRGTNLEFRTMPGEGTVESAVEVQHPVHPLLKDRVPYNVAVVSIDGAEGCNAIGNIINRGSGEVEIGQRVRAVFEEVTDPNTNETLLIPQWEAI
jgi:uncharacterized OB-fold protein